MSKFLLFVIAIVGVWATDVYSQEFTLTNTGFVNMHDGKSYYVANVDGMSKQQLYAKARSYLMTIYNSPKEVMSEVEDEQIVINAITPNYIVVVFNPAQSNMWHFRYSMKINFRDNQIRIEPQFVALDNFDTGSTVELYQLFNKKGEVKKQKAVDFVNSSMNRMVADFMTGVLAEDEW